MTFDFTDQQINLIVNVLAQRPFAEVHELMANIQQQAANQPASRPQLVPGHTPQELVGT